MSGAGFLLIIVAFAFLYFVLIRPQKKRQLQSRQMLDNVAVGDEVVTAGGIYGRIAEIHEGEDALSVEIAPGVRVRMARRAIGAVLPRVEELEEGEHEEPPAPENGG
jgi:preprotein translocase subunit YajC